MLFMNLNDYLQTVNLSRAEFANLIGVSGQAVGRYANSKRIPEPKVMKAIVLVTDGKVTPNDFYQEVAE